eukprot:Skav215235  [mRNA]  locus=scaffold341:355118:361189:- [translate_table: standard]
MAAGEGDVSKAEQESPQESPQESQEPKPDAETEEEPKGPTNEERVALAESAKEAGNALLKAGDAAAAAVR